MQAQGLTLSLPNTCQAVLIFLGLGKNPCSFYPCKGPYLYPTHDMSGSAHLCGPRQKTLAVFMQAKGLTYTLRNTCQAVLIFMGLGKKTL